MLRSDASSSDPSLLRRWFPVSGEIHLGRVPAAVWREELLKMKAGGLSMVNVYVFWIHHEESHGAETSFVTILYQHPKIRQDSSGQTQEIS
eukprot:COSAG06_NODE_39875_length_407_cov_16.847403_1_plen_91_part_01